MSKETRLARTVRRAVDRRLEKERESSKANWKIISLKVALYLVGVPSLAVGLLQLLPRLSISPQAPLISSNAFSAPFIVSNDGYIRLVKVSSICSPKNVTFIEPGHPKHQLDIQQEGRDESETGGLFISSPQGDELEPGHRLAFPCGLRQIQFPEWVVSAHILIIITYRVPFLPFIPRYHRQRFVLTKDSNSQYHWLEEPANSN